jgi:hypothetical protein
VKKLPKKHSVLLDPLISSGVEKVSPWVGGDRAVDRRPRERSARLIDLEHHLRHVDVVAVRARCIAVGRDHVLSWKTKKLLSSTTRNCFVGVLVIELSDRRTRVRSRAAGTGAAGHPSYCPHRSRSRYRSGCSRRGCRSAQAATASCLPTSLELREGGRLTAVESDIASCAVVPWRGSREPRLASSRRLQPPVRPRGASGPSSPPPSQSRSPCRSR